MSSATGELTPCTCGILFLEPHRDDVEFLEHVTNGTHARCMWIEICGLCFMGYCKGCERTRSNERQTWKCRCLHDTPLVFHDVDVRRIQLLWSDWLQQGRNSSVSIGIEVPVMDPTNPIKGEEQNEY